MKPETNHSRIIVIKISVDKFIKYNKTNNIKLINYIGVCDLKFILAKIRF